MAVLTEEERETSKHDLIERFYVRLNKVAALDTTEMRALINAADDWLEANAASYNAAIPLPLRAKATVAEKTAAFAIAAMKRGRLNPL